MTRNYSELISESESYFKTPIQMFQVLDKYSRYLPDENRRETWVETVDRAVDYLIELSDHKLKPYQINKIKKAILNLEVLPSMRLIAMAGPAARRQNLSLYNCSFLKVDDYRAFGEIMLLSMCGVGVGYSVRKSAISKLPKLPKRLKTERTTYVVPDSAEGWKIAIDRLFYNIYFNHTLLDFDFSKIRPKGARLKTKGGQASGPEPLMEVIRLVKDIVAKHYSILENGGESYFGLLNDQLTELEVHDIVTTIGDAAVSGGSRRTAMIALFDPDSNDMLNSKVGNFPANRYNANNSIVANRPYSDKQIEQQFGHMVNSGNGEPGFFSLWNAVSTAPKRRTELIANQPSLVIEGTNPCGEVNLPNMGLCNLTAVVTREDDTLDSLLEKVEIASWIGTIQSNATYFPNMRPEWELNAKQQRLLGVDITGQMDSKLLSPPDESYFKDEELIKPYFRIRDLLKHEAIKANQEMAEQLGINESVAVTCVKPSGNSSVLVDCAAGMHPRYSRYYVRNVQLDKVSPIYHMFKNQNVPMVDHPYESDKVLVQFPMKSPRGAKIKEETSALYMCEYWKLNKLSYTEHNPSVTIYYGPEEVEDVKRWLVDNKNYIGGLTFYPRTNGNHPFYPNYAIDYAEYRSRIDSFPVIDWSALPKYENGDLTNAAMEIACSSGVCELVY